MTKPTTTNRAATYCRVSTEDQSQHGYGLDVQRQQTAAYAAAFGWDVVATCVDEGISGTHTDRPGLQALLTLVRNGDVDIVIIPALDRLARRASLAIELWDTLERAGATIVCVKERVDTSTPSGRMIRTMLAGMAEYERDNIVARTTAGRDARGRKDGERGGKLPLGYKRVETLEIDESEAETVREIFALAGQGLSLRAIAQRLTAMGVPTRSGAEWKHSTVASVLRNESVYRGGNRGASAVAWPAIL